jgi:drug/metabolite transporter (DMT)-like permease
MEDWMLFAFLAPLFWAFVNVIGKFLVDKHLKNPYVLNAYCNITFFALAVPVAFFFGFSYDAFYVAVAIAGGFIAFAAYLLYTMALKVEEASRVVPLTFLYAAFASLFAFLLLGETVGVLQYAGASLLILGSVLVSLRGSLGSIAVSPALKLMLANDVLLGLGVVMEKFVLGSMSAYSLLLWMNVGIMLASVASILVSRRNRADFAAALKMPKKVGGLVWLDSLFGIVAVLLFYNALAAGPATLVSAINATQPFYALVIIIFLSAFLPRILKEEFTRATLLLKILAVLAVFAGVWLLAA